MSFTNVRWTFQVSQTITRGGPRTQIAIPAQGMIEFRDALTDLLEEFGTDDGGFKGDLPEGRYMRVDSKNFYFDIGQNNRGIYMRISEVRALRLLTCIFLQRLYDIFLHHCLFLLMSIFSNADQQSKCIFDEISISLAAICCCWIRRLHSFCFICSPLEVAQLNYFIIFYIYLSVSEIISFWSTLYQACSLICNIWKLLLLFQTVFCNSINNHSIKHTAHMTA